MPLYDYKCSKCGHVFEVQQRITEEPLKYCPLCKGGIKRLISAAGIVFKGSGFYVTDSSSKHSALSSKTKEAKKSSETTKAEVKKEEKKSTPKESKAKEISK